MPVPPHVRRLRQLVGHELLLLPSVSVLPRDDDGRVLLVRHADDGRWGTIGGAVEVDESPAEAAAREANEEAGVDVVLGPILAALGGPDFHVVYPNGDRTAYVAVVYDATMTGGTPAPDGDETLEVDWHPIGGLATLELTPFARATFAALGWL